MPVRTETRARALALQLLYAWDQPRERDGKPPREAWARLVTLQRAGARTADHALELAEAVVSNRAALDRHIEEAAERWRIERLGVVDRNVLRLAAHEIRSGAVPPKVAIDEAVRLARWFGGEKSPAFVNGVLDRVARELGRL